MDQIRAYYAESQCQGKFPDQFGPIRLREEDEAPEVITAGAAATVAAAPSPRENLIT